MIPSGILCVELWASWLGMRVGSGLRVFVSASLLSFLKKKNYYFWLCWAFLAVLRLSLVTASRGCSLVAVCRLLIAVAPLVMEHGLSGVRASVIVAHGLSCPEACGIFPN